MLDNNVSHVTQAVNITPYVLMSQRHLIFPDECFIQCEGCQGDKSKVRY